MATRDGAFAVARPRRRAVGHRHGLRSSTARSCASSAATRATTALLRRLNLPVDGGRAGGPAEAAATPSIAVLPFADMSPKHDQEYFADGVAEEILNALAHVEGLKVIGRTSSFSFKGKADDLKTIGQKLGVANVLEGSLRKEGNRIRITAQLIRVADGTHLWSEMYDRKLRPESSRSRTRSPERSRKTAGEAATLTAAPRSSAHLPAGGLRSLLAGA